MRMLLILAVLLLTGCDDLGLNRKPLTNQYIIEQTKLCRDAGLKPALLVDGFTGRAAAIECRP